MLIDAFATEPALRGAWDAQSFTIRKEQARAIETAKKAETRVNRVVKTIDLLRQKA